MEKIMEKKYRICGSLLLKCLAMVLLICTCFVTVASGLMLGVCEHFDIYTLDKAEITRRMNQNMLNRYSIGAVIAHDNDYRYSELKDTNFRYGVMKNVDFENVDIADLKNYEFNNFDDYFYEICDDRDNFNIYSCNFNESTNFMYNPSIPGGAWISNPYDMIDVRMPITGAVCDWSTGNLYLLAGDKLYPYYREVSIESLILKEQGKQEEPEEQENQESAYAPTDEHMVYEMSAADKYNFGNMGYIGTMQEYVLEYMSYMKPSEVVWPMTAVLTVDGYRMYLNGIPIVTKSEELLAYGEISEDEYSIDDRGFLMVMTENQDRGDAYYVVSYVAVPTKMGATYADGDLFAKTFIITNALYRWRYPVVAAFLVSLLIDILCFAFLCAAAGRRRGMEEVQGHFWDKVPLDVSFCGVSIIVACVLAGSALFINETIIEDFAQYRRVLPWLLAGMSGVLSVILTMGWFMSLAYHVKKKDALKHNLIWYCLALCKRIIIKCVNIVKHLWKSMKDGTDYILGHLNAFVCGILIFGIWVVLELLCMLFMHEEPGAGISFWLLVTAAELFLVIKLIRQLQEIKTGAEKIAAGELDYRIADEKLLPQLKQHAEHLNAIGEGMNTALEERMKSERMKTELITNVSHDIKTPLTSIINYVDLLEKELYDDKQMHDTEMSAKESFEREQVREYLEVLNRQSGKLKKLIEDLIEASKASTGNLSVAMKELDATVMMTQVIGEFEEKFAENQIQLQVQTPETPVMIQADSNHLWRVFDNLLNNICKYAQPQTRAYVNLEIRDSKEAVIIFRNISREPLNISSDELLERFVRADSSRHTEGNGLGLSIARSLTELMNGELKLTIDGDLFKIELTFPIDGSE